MLISVIKIGKERLCNLFGIGSYLFAFNETL